MASLLSLATGNFTAAASWALVDATSALDSEAGTTVIGTGNTDSTAFTPGAITVDGIALKLNNRAASPSGTFTVILRNSTAGLDVASVVVNAADLPYSGYAQLGWVFFKFGASQLLLGATNYLVRVTCSVASQVTLYTNGGTNLSRKIRTTTTQAPAVNDQLVICGELTGAGTGNNIVITLDNTATTSFGPTVSGGPPQGVVISKRGTLICGVAASTAYYLKWKGVMLVAKDGTLTVGTAGTPIPSTSSCTLYCDSVVGIDTGIQVRGGTVTLYGAAKNSWTLLTANVAGAGTVLTLQSTSGWANGDALAVASTSNVAAQSEQVAVATVDSATQVTLSAGVANAHSGTSPTQGEVLNLTRNVLLRGVSSTNPGFLYVAEAGTLTAAYVEHYLMGSNAAGKRGVDVVGGFANVDIQYCSFHDFLASGAYCMYFSGTSSSTALTIKHNVFYNSQYMMIIDNGAFGAASAFDDNVLCKNTNQWPLSISNAMTNAGSWRIISYNNSPLLLAAITMSSLTIHSNSADWAVNVANVNVTINGGSVWRTRGVYLNNVVTAVYQFSNMNIYTDAGTNTGIRINQILSPQGQLVFTSCAFNSDPAAGSTNGIQIDASSGGIYFNACSFGATYNFTSAHILLGTAAAVIYGDATTFNLATQIVNMATSLSATALHLQAVAAGDHRTIYPQGTAKTDTVIFNTASPSERDTPSSASVKMISSPKQQAVANAATCTFSVYVRKSANSDAGGVDYNGSQPRLILRKNYSAGIAADVVLATMSAGLAAWQKITGTSAAVSADCVLEAYVDCDGTTGWINVDDWGTA